MHVFLRPAAGLMEELQRNSRHLVEAAAALKADPGVKGILVPGSISVVQQLLAAGLIDELRLLIHPVAARKGRKLFDEGALRRLTLLDVGKTSGGALLAHYAVR